MPAAEGTFRAAPIEQPEILGRRIDAPVIERAPSLERSAAACIAVATAKCHGAGRASLGRRRAPSQQGRPDGRAEEDEAHPRAPAAGGAHETILVLDATTGQNPLSRARRFNDTFGVTGITLPKLDVTAQGGNHDRDA